MNTEKDTPQGAAITDLDKLIADLNEFADEVERGEYALDSELHKLFRSAAARLVSLREYGEEAVTIRKLRSDKER